MADITYTQFPIEADIVDISQIETDISNAQTDILNLGQNKADKTTTINGLSLAQNRTLYVQDIPSKNILNPYFVNGSLSNTGEDTSTPNRLRSIFIPVQPSTTYTLQMTSSTIKWQEYDEYTSAKSWIGYTSINATSKTFTTGSTTAYIKLIATFNTGTAISPSDLDGCNLQLELGSTATAYVPYAKTNAELSQGLIDISSSFVWNPSVTFSTKTLVAFYDPVRRLVMGNMAYDASAAISASTYHVQIASAYRPKSNSAQPCMYYHSSDSAWKVASLTFGANGNITQGITNYWKSTLCSFMYSV